MGQWEIQDMGGLLLQVCFPAEMGKVARILPIRHLCLKEARERCGL